ncbi:hypothetical protein N6H05_15570 [Sphingobium sp. WTD-1]|uniref:hypothetical protein n=1 Tax=Sphingobium sp. WTD-1 TaxID=2979467 RepID=UPI0024DE156F|nr:hypothetical protein [Sphingobium sp. WTD-1]WIA54477.1 hypothetical protein N6H05_15570 [Sphingobium sp. WTD-1]
MRWIAVDTDSRLLMVTLTLPTVHIDRTRLMDVAAYQAFVLEVISGPLPSSSLPRPEDQPALFRHM